jgi:hypothetical protein
VLIATAEKQNQHLAVLPVVNAETRPDIDPKFKDTIAYRLPIAKQPRFQPIQPGHNTGTANRISQSIQPFGQRDPARGRLVFPDFHK